MKERSPKGIEKATTRWIVAAVVLVLYMMFFSVFYMQVDRNLNRALGTQSFNSQLIRDSFGIEAAGDEQEWVDLDKLGEPEEIERNAQARCQYFRDEIVRVQARIDELKAGKGAQS